MTCSNCQSFSWKCVPPVLGRPKKSCHSPTQMITPMPAVKPTITGAGMNRITPPNRASPIATSITPAMMVAISSPSTPCTATTPARITMNAPVGPAICTRLPPNTDTISPAMIEV